jgi:radical SAM superfamily enzyme YgiQ (UPF0313 family)
MRFEKVMLIAVPLLDPVKPPAALPVLAACCEATNSKYHVIDLNLWAHKNLSRDQIEDLQIDIISGKLSESSEQCIYRIGKFFLQEINQFQPDLLAISVFTFYSILVTEMLLRQLQSSISRSEFKIVLGGIGVQSAQHELTKLEPFGVWARKQKLVEHVITGEGEISFLHFLQGDLDYPGIDDKAAQQIMDLDILSSPSFKQISPKEYFYSDVPEVTITGSKGCVRSCSFCDVGHYWSKYVYRSGTKVALDMYNIWRETGVQKFDFSDSLINGSLKNFRLMIKELKRLKQEHPDFNPTWHGQFIARPIGQMKYQDYADMKAAGVDTLVVGIEHFSQSVRTHMGKHFDNAAIDWHFETCGQLGIKNVLLLLSGYLTETSEDHAVNLEYLRRYQAFALTRIIFSVGIEISGLVILPGAPLYHWIHQNYDISDDKALEDFILPQNPSLTELEKIRRATELVLTAADLGYNVMHFKMKLKNVKKQLHELMTKKNKNRVFLIDKMPKLSLDLDQ